MYTVKNHYMVNYKKKKMRGGGPSRDSDSSTQSSRESFWFDPTDVEFADKKIFNSRFHRILILIIVLIALGFTGLVLFKILKK